MDANGLLTVIAILVAGYTLLSEERRIDISIRTSCLDWFLFSAPIGIILVNIYSPVILALGISPKIPWFWGFSRETLIFSCLSFLMIYFTYKTLDKKIPSSNYQKLSNLMVRLLREKKFHVLGYLLDRYQSQILKIIDKKTWLVTLHNYIQPKPRISFTYPPAKESWTNIQTQKGRRLLARLVPSSNKSQTEVTYSVGKTLKSQAFIKYISETHPLVAARFTDSNALRNADEFIDNFFVALISNPGSPLYRELRDNQNCSHTGEYYIDESNELLSFYLADIAVAKKVELWKPIGDYVIEFIESQRGPDNYYNQANGRFSDGEERWKCPVFIGTFFFEVMVSAAIFQKCNYHMWLMYCEIFVEKMLKQLNRSADLDLRREFPSKFDYLIYHAFSSCTSWVGSAIHLEHSESVSEDSPVHWAARSLGTMYRKIIHTDAISENQQIYFLEMILRLSNKLDSHKLNSHSNTIYEFIVKEYEWSEIDSKTALRLASVYAEVDHVLRINGSTFDTKISQKN